MGFQLHALKIWPRIQADKNLTKNSCWSFGFCKFCRFFGYSRWFSYAESAKQFI